MFRLHVSTSRYILAYGDAEGTRIIRAICTSCRCGLWEFHWSTSPASVIPCASPHAYRCSTTSVAPSHCHPSVSTFSSIHNLARVVIGQKVKTVPAFATSTSGVGTTGVADFFAGDFTESPLRFCRRICREATTVAFRSVGEHRRKRTGCSGYKLRIPTAYSKHEESLVTLQDREKPAACSQRASCVGSTAGTFSRSQGGRDESGCPPRIRTHHTLNLEQA